MLQVLSIPILAPAAPDSRQRRRGRGYGSGPRGLASSCLCGSTCLWEHAAAGAAQRYVRLTQTRRTARMWQLNTGAAAMRSRYGPGVSIPTTDSAEIEALGGSNPHFAACEQNEPYTIALLIKDRSGGASISTCTGRAPPALPITFCSLRAAPPRTCVTRRVRGHGHHHVVLAIVTIPLGRRSCTSRFRTPRAVCGRLLACLSTAAATTASAPTEDMLFLLHASPKMACNPTSPAPAAGRSGLPRRPGPPFT
jgi:hypothetical protein